LADERGFRLDVIDALRELQIPVVRWPGGCFVSAYHWLDGVGPDRQPTYDKAWRVEDPNTFGTNEFIAWCRAIGAEPYICTNAGTGTPEEMSNWVEYCNLATEGRWAQLRRSHGVQAPHGVKYWSIGNENYLSGEMGAKTAAEWGPFVAESAKMIRRVSPDAKLLAAAVPDVDWTLNLLKAAGQYLDYVSVHGYWDPLWQENRPSNYLACMARSLEPEATIRKVEQIIGVAGLEGRVAIAFDEWNLRGWHHPNGNTSEAIAARDKNDDPTTYTMADAIFSAVFLNTCLRHPQTVRMANMAPLVNTRGPLFVHPGGIVRRTTFHVFAMYGKLLAPNVLDSWTGSDEFAAGDRTIPAIDAVVTCDEAQERMVIALVNRHPTEPVACEIVLGGQRIEGTWSATLLSGEHADAYNDIEHPDRVAPQRVSCEFRDGTVEIPAHSVVVYEQDTRSR
jgi:alpha-N-arabinofuranosidase